MLWARPLPRDVRTDIQQYLPHHAILESGAAEDGLAPGHQLGDHNDWDLRRDDPGYDGAMRRAAVRRHRGWREVQWLDLPAYRSREIAAASNVESPESRE